MNFRHYFIYILLISLLSISYCTVAAGATTLLNVSYDPTRELYDDYNKYFPQYWKAKTGNELRIQQSHAGSASQARAIIEGLEADVATLALAYDIDTLAQHHLLSANWQTLLPHNSCPYTSTIIFMVRKGNPKNIKDWPDLIRPGVKVITPNPKTSGGARWNYLAAWGFAINKYKNEAAAQEFIKKLFKNVPVLDSAARGATNTFVQRQIGDVLLAWESEALMVINKIGGEKVELVIPSLSILTEPPVAVLTKITENKGTTLAATAYLEQLYSLEGQNIIAKHYYRPQNNQVNSIKFPTVNLFTIRDLGGWKAVQQKFFDEGGLFDQIYEH